MAGRGDPRPDDVPRRDRGRGAAARTGVCGGPAGPHRVRHRGISGARTRREVAGAPHPAVPDTRLLRGYRGDLRRRLVARGPRGAVQVRRVLCPAGRRADVPGHGAAAPVHRDHSTNVPVLRRTGRRLVHVRGADVDRAGIPRGLAGAGLPSGAGDLAGLGLQQPGGVLPEVPARVRRPPLARGDGGRALD